MALSPAKLLAMFSVIAVAFASPITAQQPFAAPASHNLTASNTTTAEPATSSNSFGKSWISEDASNSANDTNGCCEPGLFGRGLIKRSDQGFDQFISPMTNPVFFEDPRALTEARMIYLNHKLPVATGGGNVQLFALQMRARLSDNVSLIATKDGYITSSNPLVDDGWADLAAGLKFNLIRDYANQAMLSGGFTFELPTGEASAFQGNGDGELNLFLTGGKQIGCRSHWISASGFRLPMNTTDESSVFYWSNHVDYRILNKLYVLAEVNWYHWMGAGQDGPLPGIEGLDVMNFGNPGVAGNDIVTFAPGTKFKPSSNSEIGLAWEFPLTERRDILEDRLTFDWIIRY